MSTTSSNEAASTTESPKVSTAHLMTALAGADSKPSLTAASSSVVNCWSLTLVSATDPSLSPGADRAVLGGPPPALDARPNAGSSIHDQNGHDLRGPMDSAAASAPRRTPPPQAQSRSGPAGRSPPWSGPSSTPSGHLDLLESLAIFIIREVAAESERPVLLFSGGKDSAVLLHLAAKAFKPGRIPFPVLHVDTGHNFPEVLAYRDAQVEAEGARLMVAKRAGLHRPGPRGRSRAGGLAQPPADHDPARCHQRQRVRRRLRRRPPGRGQGPGQGAGPLVPRLVRAVGPQAPASRALAALPGQRASGRAPARLPVVGLDRARHLAVHPPRAHRAAVHLLRP